MKLLTGFFMAWGNFLTLPCPCKKWDNDLKNYMLGFLPTVGLILGVLWAALCIFMVWLGVPFLVHAFLLTFILFALCGFLHLDGFMDCCDAILSRRPLAQRQEILKDSHCGAFAVVSVVFMILAYFSCLATSLGGGIDFVDLCLVPVVSRTFAGVNVLLSKPIGHSQYAQGAGSDDQRQKKSAAGIAFAQLAIFCTIGILLSTYVIPTLVVVASTAAGTLIAIAAAKKSLGGMSGDIAGFGIVWGELIGVFAMLVL